MALTVQTTLNDRPCLVLRPGEWPMAEGRAHSFSCPVGREHGTGWTLVDRKTLDAIGGVSAQSLRLKFSCGQSVEFPKLWCTRAVKACASPVDAPGGVYLVEFVDRRYLMERFTCINRQFNVRAPCAPEPDTGSPSPENAYYTDSLNSGEPWTWTTLLTRIWDDMGAVKGTGAFPSLPYTPDGTPEGWRFIGVSAWQAFCEVCAKILLVPVYDPILDTFSLKAIGDAQAEYATEDAKVGKLFDSEARLTGQTAKPKVIRVFFPRREKHYGAGVDTTPGNNNIAMTPAYSVDVTLAGGAATLNGTIMPLWDDMTAEYDATGTLTNGTALSTRATEVANLWGSAQQQRGGKIYPGIVRGMRPGAKLTRVTWGNTGDGWTTTVSLSPLAAVLDKQVGRGGFGAAGENLAPPDHARHTLPLYPDTLQFVTIDGSGEQDPNGDGLFAAYVVRIDPDDIATGPFQAEACWVTLINADTALKLVGGEMYMAKLCGTATSGTEKKPLYLVSRFNWKCHSADVSGYDDTKTQFLRRVEDGCIEWIDVNDTPCEPA